jgi:hypothetical protein
MTKQETKALEVIIGKIEALQHRLARDGNAQNGLGKAKSELLYLLRNPQ